jgi:hypothetical protein
MTINARDLKKILYVAENTNFGEQFSELSGVLADRVHSRDWTGKNPCVCTTMEVCALFKWQGIQFNGEWDMKGVSECYDWLKNKIEIIDLEDKWAEVKAVVTRNTQIGKKDVSFKLTPTTDGRFANLEI